MIEGSKRNTLVAIDSDDGSTPKARHSPEPDNNYLDTLDKADMKTHNKEDQNITKNQNFSQSFSLPEITTDLYVDTDENIITDDSISTVPLKKVDTIFDLSEDESPESPTLGYQDYKDNRSIESFDSHSD